jgi:hypothetical protein
MSIGPVQLIVVGFDQPKFGGSVARELKRLRERDIVRVIDALVVQKNAEGQVAKLQVSDLTLEQAEEFGAVVGGLIGLGSAEEGMETGAGIGGEDMAEPGGHVLEPEEGWSVLDDIPKDTAAAIVLLEHLWAIPLRDAILREGGMPLGESWLHPRDLVAAGLMAAEEAEQQGVRTP